MKCKRLIVTITIVILIFTIQASCAFEDDNDFNLTQTIDVEHINVQTEDVKENPTLAQDNISNEVSVSPHEEVLSASNNHDDLQDSNKPEVLGVSNNDDLLGRYIYITTPTMSELRNRINSASPGDWIFLNELTYTGHFNSISINKRLIICGGSSPTDTTRATLDLSQFSLAKQSRFTISNAPVTFNGIDFVNHNYSPTTGDESGRGHLISVSSSITMENCNFIDNTVFQKSHIIEFTSNAKELSTINNCQFINNTASLIISTNSAGMKFTANNNRFINNTGTINDINNTNSLGLCIKVQSSDSTFDNNTFINNRNAVHGAAYCINARNVVITNNHIENNQASYGAGIECHDGHVKVYNTTFIGNNASGINYYANSRSGTGGAIAFIGDNNYIENCTFINNFAENYGGAICIHPFQSQNADDAYVKNSRFENNIAQTKSAGAIYIQGKNAKIDNCNFTNNSAPAGGAIQIIGLNAQISNSIFIDNNAIVGGAAYLNGEDMNLTDSNFTDNAAIHGGGVYVDGENNRIINSNFKNNNATYYLRVNISGNLKTKGGAIYINKTNTVIENSKFHNNSANTIRPYNSNGNNLSASDDGFGGAIYVGANNTTLKSSEFNDNKACNGSALYNDASKTLLDNDTFLKNQAWSYLLNAKANPNSTYYGSEAIIVLNHIGGDNILNSIYNAADVKDILFNEVTYIVNNSESEIRKTEKSVSPVLGATSSTELYQDSLERYQEITIELISNADGKTVLTKNVKTDLYDNYSFNASGLLPGNYTVKAYHNEDRNYKYILSTTNLEIIPFVDLNITKEVSSYYTINGKNVTFTVTVNNANNASNATNLTIKDVLPIGLENILVTVTEGVYDKTKNLWTIDQLDNGTSAILTIVFTATKFGKFNNTVNVACNEDEWNYTNNNATVWFEVIPFNLTISKTAEVDTVAVNKEITFTINVTNNARVDATNVTITDSVPAGFEFVRSSDDYDDKTGLLIIPIIKAYESYVFTITLKAIMNGTLTNTANVSCSENDTVITSSVDVNITPVVNLTVVKVADISDATIGDVITFTITVTNNGPSNATNIKVTNILDEGFTLVSGELEQIIPFLAIDKSTTIVVQVRTTARGTYTNRVTVNCSENNTVKSANATVQVYITDLKINKMPTQSEVSVGEFVNFTIVVKNHGKPNATNINITDVLDDAFEFVSANGTYTRNGQTIVWTIPTLTSEETYTVSVSVHVLTNGTIENIARVNCSEEGTIKNSTSTVKAIPVVDLTVVKVADISDATIGDVITFTITVTNNGPSNATNIKVTNILDEGFTLVSGELEQIIPFLASDESTTIVVKVQATANGTYTNNVNVTCDQNDTIWTSDASVHVYITDIKINNTVEVSVVSANNVLKVITLVNIDAGSATGYVYFTINGKEYRQNLVNGKATFNLENVAPGKYSTNVYFVGSGDWANATQNLTFEIYKQRGTITAHNAAYSIVYGGTYSANTNMANQKITFTINGKTYTVNTDDDGVAKIKLTKAMFGKVGTKTMTISLSSNYFTANSATAKITVKKEKTKFKVKKTFKFKNSKKTKKIKVTLKDSENKAVKKVKVTLKLKGKTSKGKKTYTLKTNKKGVATFKITSKKTKFAKKGKYTATITFKGNNNYNKVIKKVKLIIR